MSINSEFTNKNQASFLSYEKTVKLNKEELQSCAASSFQTHPTDEKMAKYSHKATVVLSFPFRMGLRSLAYVVEPLPGKNKDKTWLGVAVRVAAIFSAVVLVPVGLVTIPFAIPFYLYSHSKKQAVSMVHNKNAEDRTNKDNTLHVRSHNLGFVHEFLSVMADLRDVETRAHEIGEWLSGDENLPEVICFQEGFHIDGSKVLVDKLKEKYPYVLHNISPHGSGFNSGGIIASQYPIEEFSYRSFTNLIGPEKLATKGLIKVRVEKNGKKIDVYETHLQALLGKERAAVRKEQMEQIINWIKEDQTVDDSEKADAIVLLGDLNASKITAWGEVNSDDDAVFALVNDNFVDVFSNDHDENGVRTEGAARFNQLDSPDENTPLPEPSGSWYLGPFADKGAMLRIKEWYERKSQGSPKKEPVMEIPKDHFWGTTGWVEKQHALHTRFDFILRYPVNKGDGEKDKAEIRRVKVKSNVPSAPSDHAPMDAIIDLGESLKLRT